MSSSNKRIFIALFLLYAGFFHASPAHAGIIDELRGKIRAHSNEIEKMETEIKEYEEAIERTNAAAETFESAIDEIALTEKKLRADISVTERKIRRTNLTVDSLSWEIDDKQSLIQHNTAAIAGIIREMHELESRSLIEIMLSYDSFSSFWNKIESLGRFQASVHRSVDKLKLLKDELLKKRNERREERQRHVALKWQLSDQKQLVSEQKESKERLLDITKSQESNYRALLEERRARKEALEQEILAFEEELRVEIDPSSLPKTGTGILRWPLDSVFITQYFGNTPFASKNPQVYSGGGHNGVDFRASVGTVVKAAANGVVMDTGDTDARDQCPGASYGKWVLVRHYNNLATLYAHLSLVRVAPGQELKASDTVGYSGNSGYSTGPHLHLTVYAAPAVRVTADYKSRVCGTNLKLPLSPRNGYLNPLSYLPSI